MADLRDKETRDIIIESKPLAASSGNDHEGGEKPFARGVEYTYLLRGHREHYCFSFKDAAADGDSFELIPLELDQAYLLYNRLDVRLAPVAKAFTKFERMRTKVAYLKSHVQEPVYKNRKTFSKKKYHDIFRGIAKLAERQISAESDGDGRESAFAGNPFGAAVDVAIKQNDGKNECPECGGETISHGGTAGASGTVCSDCGNVTGP